MTPIRKLVGLLVPAWPTALAATIAVFGCGAAAQTPGQQVDPLLQLVQMPVAEALLRGLDVEVVDQHGNAAASAVLVVLPRIPPMAVHEQAQARFPDDPWRAMATIVLLTGVRYPLDADGHAYVPSNGACRLLACAGATSAMQPFTPPEQVTAKLRLRLQLQPARRIGITVLQHDGTPAVGLPIRVQNWRTVHDHGLWTTDRDGKARIAWPNLGSNGGYDELMVLAATKVLLHRHLNEIDGHETFRLPPCTSLRLVFEGNEHRRAPADAAIKFLLTCETERGNTWIAPTSVDADGQAATFAFVEPGSKLNASARIDDGQPVMFTSVGPFSLGDAPTITLDPSMVPATISLRVLDPSGQPLTNHNIHFEWRRPHNRFLGSHATDADGKLLLTVRKGYPVLRLEMHRGGRDDGPLEAAVDLPAAEIGSGRTECLDVRLAEVPVALAGKVVDVHGAPAEGVRLLLAGATDYTAGHYSDCAVTDESGHFTLRLRKPHPPELYVKTDKQGQWFLAEDEHVEASGIASQAVAAGTTDARLVVHRGGNLLLGVHGLPENVQFRLTVTAVPPGARLHGYRAGIRGFLRADTSQLKMPAGTWDLVFHFPQQRSATEVFRIERVQVTADVENHDPRLMQLDWRQFGAIATVRVETPDGQPCSECRVSLYLHTGRHAIDFGRHPEAGVSHVFVPKAGGGIRITPRDDMLRIVDLGYVTGEHVVRLAASPRLTVQLSAMPEVPDGWQLLAVASAVNRSQGYYGRTNFDEHGRGVLGVQSTGAFTVTLTMRRGRLGRPVYLTDPIPFEIEDADAALEIELTDEMRQKIAKAADDAH